MGFHRKKSDKIIELLDRAGLLKFIDYEWEE